MGYLMGIDLGTSGTKSVLFDLEGNRICSHMVEYDFEQPQNGWAEQDPEMWWNGAAESIKRIMEKSGIDSREILGVGVAGQMHGLVMLDEKGSVLRKSIIWCDGRTGSQCREIEQAVGRERLVEISGNPALPGFTAGKILWVKENEPELYRKCRTILLPKDYVRFRLTGLCAQEVSDASGTNLLDIRKRCWSDEIIEAVGLERSMFPEVRESAAPAGFITAEAAAATGLCQGTPVCMGAGDNAAAAVGTGVVCGGRAFTSIGTSGVVFAHADKPVVDGMSRVHTFCHAVPDGWAVMSCTLSAGLSLKWFKNTFCSSEQETADKLGISPYEVLSEIAAKAPAGCDRLFFLPYLMGERSPILDEKARGAFIGLSAIHTKSHLTRAVMEGVMFSQLQCLRIIQGMDIYPEKMYACGGGAKSSLWRQMMADLYESPVYTLGSDEGPALGAAILAGVASGVFDSVQSACEHMVKTAGETLPNNTESYKPYYEVYTQLYEALKPCFHKISSL